MNPILRTALSLCAALPPLTATADSLLITNVTVTPSDVRVDWNAASDLYILAQTPSLTTGAFDYVDDVVSTNTSTVPNDATTSFYRIRQVEVVPLPDPNFESVVRSAIPYKYAPTNQVYDIDVEPITSLSERTAGITSITGVAWMTGLTNFDCRDNAITEMDVSACTNLVVLDSSWNQLTELDVSQNTALIALSCEKNTNMTHVVLPSNGKLVTLYCHWNPLTVLDISGNTNLVEVYAHFNTNLTEIIVWDTNNLPAIYYEEGLDPWIHEP